MSQDGILVNHAGLEQAAQDLSGMVKGIENRLHSLESELAPLKSDWMGSAQEAYTTAKQKWDRAMEEMKTLLAETSTAVSTSNEDYRAADKRGAASFEI